MNIPSAPTSGESRKKNRGNNARVVAAPLAVAANAHNVADDRVDQQDRRDFPGNQEKDASAGAREAEGPAAEDGLEVPGLKEADAPAAIDPMAGDIPGEAGQGDGRGAEAVGQVVDDPAPHARKLLQKRHAPAKAVGACLLHAQ